MERINYTLYINLVKKTLWILSIVLIILIFFNKSLKIYLELDLKEEFNEIGSNQIIENPQFLSTDKKNRPFVLKAKKAKRKESTKNIFILDSPSGNLENNNGFITLKSMNGKFDQDKEMLFLFKPQFEVGSIGLNKQGVVKKTWDILQELEKFTDWCQSELVSIKGYCPCEIKGKKGNQEFFIYMIKKEKM